MAGGMVVTPDVIEYAKMLDPVVCCEILGLKLEDGGVPFRKLLVDRSESTHIKSVLVDAIILHGLCHFKCTPFPNISCYNVCLEGGKYHEELLLHRINDVVNIVLTRVDKQMMSRC